MTDRAAPDNTAIRVALWRALHVLLDDPPHVFTDEAGLRLAAPDEGWRRRPDMDPNNTKIFRASIVARARFIEDLVGEEAGRGVAQYVILGAGLDTFAVRQTELAAKLRIFEIDQPVTQKWKQQRLAECGLKVPASLKFVPVDFEAGDAWLKLLATAGFDAKRPAVVASTGVAMYLTRDAVAASLREVASLARGSTLAMSYLLPMEMAAPEERIGREMAEKGARAAGTPFLSYFAPEDIQTMARAAGFKSAASVTAADMGLKYFSGRSDGLHPTKSEEILIAKT